MLNAGISIINSLDILERQTENGTIKRAISIVLEDVQKGFTLSEDEKAWQGISSPIGKYGGSREVSGNLDVLMERMAIHYEKENKIENKIKTPLYIQ